MRKKLRVVCWSKYEARLFSAAFSIAFFGALRVGEMVVEDHRDGRSWGLFLQDVQLSPTELRITVRHSKTDQRGPAPVRVWMVGHSIVHWAGVAARQVGVGPGLGLPPHVQLSWLSRRGMRWSELLPRIRSQLLREGPPSAIVIQLGENDLVAMDCFSLRAAIWTDLGTLRAMVPSTKLFWSQLLQRCVWRGSRCPVAIERARKRINFAAKRRIEELGGEVISHPAILFKMPSFFRDDGVHLSASGNEAWLGAVVAKLRSWLGL
ncbi:uncharacterized protein LOC144328460 [Podarcis muralis]